MKALKFNEAFEMFPLKEVFLNPFLRFGGNNVEIE